MANSSNDKTQFDLKSARRIDRAVRAYERMPDSRHGPVLGGNGSDIYPILNSSGQDLERFNIIGISGPYFDPTTKLAQFKNQISFVGVLPVAPTHFSRWGVLWAPVKKDAWGLFQVGGFVVPVQVDVTDTTHYNAGITSGDPTHLTSAQIAVARMLLPTPSTGVMWQYVTLNNTFRTTTKECT